MWSFLKTSLQKVKALVVVCLALFFFKITCLAITEDIFVSDPFNGTVTLMYSITVAESVQVPKETMYHLTSHTCFLFLLS